jgi:hypothetical protein
VIPKERPRHVAPGAPGVEVNFRVLHEDWSVYDILDGRLRIRGRAIPLHIYEPVDKKMPDGKAVPEGAMAVGVAPMVATYTTDPSLWGPPSTEPLSEKEIDRGGEIVKVRVIDEPVNSYLIDGYPQRVLEMRNIAARIKFYPKRYDPFGGPMIHLLLNQNLSPAREATLNELARLGG